MAKRPSVFISYSWDSPAHKRWVEGLALRLVTAGVDVVLDQWQLRPGQSLTEFMEKEIKRAGHIIIVCSPQYAKRSNQRKGGVGYEQQIISGRIAAGIPRRKFIPVIRAGTIDAGRNCAIPTHFGGIYSLDMRTRYLTEKNVPVLAKTILGHSASSAVLPKKSKAKGKPAALRLPNKELDGWDLHSGVVSSQRAPKTFTIPPEDERLSIRPGDVAKLIFYFYLSSGDEFGERMWVRVLGTRGPYYFGTLANQPITYVDGDQRKLKYGDEVIFLPEHVIDIDIPTR